MARQPIQQTVAKDTPNPASSGTASDGAQVSPLDALLNEWEGTSGEQPATTVAPQQNVTSNDLRDVVNFAKEQRERQLKQEFDAAVSTAVQAAKGDLEIDDRLVRGFLEVEYQENPNFATAWQNQQTNPAAFKALLGEMNGKLSNVIGAKQAETVAEDRRAVEAAIRGASPGAANAEALSDEKKLVGELAGMSIAQLENWKVQNGLK